MLVERRAPRAELAQAGNSFVVEARGALFGDNTDGVGLVTELMRIHGVAIAGRSVLLLGAGGAASGVVGPLLAERPARLIVANRTVDRALALAGQFARVGPHRPSTVSACWSCRRRNRFICGAACGRRRAR